MTHLSPNLTRLAPSQVNRLRLLRVEYRLVVRKLKALFKELENISRESSLATLQEAANQLEAQMVHLRTAINELETDLKPLFP
jgi:uncharacterized protein YhaN